MTVTMKTLRDEHDELLPWLETVLMTADRVGEAPFDIVRELIDEVYEFLTRHLIPHATAEDEVLYPTVERVSGARGSTATMSRDHVEIGRLTDELGELRAHLAARTPGNLQAKALRRILYGLYALVRVHFAKEEEILVPILEKGLSQDEAEQMFLAMEDAAERARGRAMEHAHPGSRSLPA